MTTTTIPASSHNIKDGQHSPVLTNYNLTCLKTSNAEEDNPDREIHKLGKHLPIAPKKPYLWPQDFQRHLAFAQAHRHWTINDWAWVVWTDESALELWKKVDCVRVWRTPQEKWNLENLAVNHLLGRQSLMANDLDQEGSASLLTGPASIHSLDEAGPLDSWLPPPPFDGGQCLHPHGPSKHRLVRLERDPEARLAGSFT
ncbi:hypothetical protein O181_040907 [Austropuccinia psidii MF-1]|uniref:Uncharacterized protein n=1 Tax=Austropuccinia psidii MF-1 TaxID=1389203 RepID=A0A9Q3HEC6_9BASI|nr:hypothetical protein [Austropuccinia psidii MF-1]